jgi:hypothetical protein
MQTIYRTGESLAGVAMVNNATLLDTAMRLLRRPSIRLPLLEDNFSSYDG